MQRTHYAISRDIHRITARIDHDTLTIDAYMHHGYVHKMQFDLTAQLDRTRETYYIRRSADPERRDDEQYRGDIWIVPFAPLIFNHLDSDSVESITPEGHRVSIYEFGFLVDSQFRILGGRRSTISRDTINGSIGPWSGPPGRTLQNHHFTIPRMMVFEWLSRKGFRPTW